jgi:hypothetical protein
MNAVKWYGSFGIVPGLALLETRLGWISSWFALDASLNHGLLAERMYSLPGLLVLTLSYLASPGVPRRAASSRGRAFGCGFSISVYLHVRVLLEKTDDSVWSS